MSTTVIELSGTLDDDELIIGKGEGDPQQISSMQIGFYWYGKTQYKLVGFQLYKHKNPSNGQTQELVSYACSCDVQPHDENNPDPYLFTISDSKFSTWDNATIFAYGRPYNQGSASGSANSVTFLTMDHIYKASVEGEQNQLEPQD